MRMNAAILAQAQQQYENTMTDAKRLRASNDGHLCGGKGRVTFTAIEQE